MKGAYKYLKYTTAYEKATNKKAQYIDGSIAPEFIMWLIVELEAWQEMYFDDTGKDSSLYNEDSLYEPLVEQ